MLKVNRYQPYERGIMINFVWRRLCLCIWFLK